MKNNHSTESRVQSVDFTRILHFKLYIVRFCLSVFWTPAVSNQQATETGNFHTNNKTVAKLLQTNYLNQHGSILKHGRLKFMLVQSVDESRKTGFGIWNGEKSNWKTTHRKRKQRKRRRESERKLQVNKHFLIFKSNFLKSTREIAMKK